MKAVLIRSRERFDAFLEKMRSRGIEVTVLDFAEQEWVSFDYGAYDFLVFYPSFAYSSSHPLALYAVYDNLMHISERFPGLAMYPDPGIIRFYNDKYRQYLFLSTRDFPIPRTIPLFSEQAVDRADREFGYPMVVKNRYGAGGGSVYKVSSKRELERLYRISQLDFMHAGTFGYIFNLLKYRMFYYHLIKARSMPYPLLSPPLLAQEFITTDRDLKTVVGNGKVVEGHWRFQASPDQWKVNIDGGGIGQWSHIPREAIELSERLASELNATWINLDLMPVGSKFLISEFSPVWHHYAYREKPSFVYKDDYNIDMPLEESLDLEGILLRSLIDATSSKGTRRQKQVRHLLAH
jgi:hypothetical protein